MDTGSGRQWGEQAGCVAVRRCCGFCGQPTPAANRTDVPQQRTIKLCLGKQHVLDGAVCVCRGGGGGADSRQAGRREWTSPQVPAVATRVHGGCFWFAVVSPPRAPRSSPTCCDIGHNVLGDELDALGCSRLSLEGQRQRGQQAQSRVGWVLQPLGPAPTPVTTGGLQGAAAPTVCARRHSLRGLRPGRR